MQYLDYYKLFLFHSLLIYHLQHYKACLLSKAVSNLLTKY